MSKYSKSRSFDKENRKIYYSVLFLFLLIFGFFIIKDQPWKERGCYFNETQYFPQEFKGVVKEKYIDKKNHNYRMMRFEDEKTINLISDKYYSKIEIGDSICKLANSYELAIFKANDTITLEYKMSCNE